MMNITIQLKRLGKKKIKKVSVQLKSTPANLKQLIEACVANEVTQYNEKREHTFVLSFLSSSDIAEQSESGKVAFGDLTNATLANQQTAIQNALLAFADGLFLVFIDDNEITALNEPITFSESSVVSFIRMTFLTGM